MDGCLELEQRSPPVPESWIATNVLVSKPALQQGANGLPLGPCLPTNPGQLNWSRRWTAARVGKSPMLRARQERWIPAGPGSRARRQSFPCDANQRGAPRAEEQHPRRRGPEVMAAGAPLGQRAVVGVKSLALPLAKHLACCPAVDQAAPSPYPRWLQPENSHGW